MRLTPFALEHMPTADSSGGELLGALAASAAFIALMGLVSWLIFRRADVK